MTNVTTQAGGSDGLLVLSPTHLVHLLQSNHISFMTFIFKLQTLIYSYKPSQNLAGEIFFLFTILLHASGRVTYENSIQSKGPHKLDLDPAKKISVHETTSRVYGENPRFFGRESPRNMENDER